MPAVKECAGANGAVAAGVAPRPNPMADSSLQHRGGLQRRADEVAATILKDFDPLTTARRRCSHGQSRVEAATAAEFVALPNASRARSASARVYLDASRELLKARPASGCTCPTEHAAGTGRPGRHADVLSPFDQPAAGSGRRRALPRRRQPRPPQLTPDIPTLIEQGIPDFELSTDRRDDAGGAPRPPTLHEAIVEIISEPTMSNARRRVARRSRPVRPKKWRIRWPRSALRMMKIAGIERNGSSTHSDGIPFDVVYRQVMNMTQPSLPRQVNWCAMPPIMATAGPRQSRNGRPSPQTPLPRPPSTAPARMVVPGHDTPGSARIRSRTARTAVSSADLRHATSAGHERHRHERIPFRARMRATRSPRPRPQRQRSDDN